MSQYFVQNLRGHEIVNDSIGDSMEGPKKDQRLGTMYSYSASLWAWEEFYQVEKVLEF